MTAAALHPDVDHAIHSLGDALPEHDQLVPEPDNAEYGAVTTLPAATRFRVAKLTPTKPGFFVTVWRRDADGTTQPFPSDDDTQHLVVVTRDSNSFGAFVFPLRVLVARGIVSVDGHGGKRGFRVYPPWADTRNRQAQNTQRWQCEHFHPLSGR
ncbi:MepB family protein [Salinibacterium sp. PAMC 21357]|uniref:MepB family protein n=1 Tax=Salinibacterium sp. PAMC 21357 TaxID=1112215 RepID=UPI000288D50C|nr:MepB family protein [Salinibacterium sp. PAMC 21357]